jgi:hypothetical protein
MSWCNSSETRAARRAPVAQRRAADDAECARSTPAGVAPQEHPVSNREVVRAGKRTRGHVQRAGTWHELRATSGRHWPMTHGRDRGAAAAANSARHGGEGNLPAHHQRSDRSAPSSPRLVDGSVPPDERGQRTASRIKCPARPSGGCGNAGNQRVGAPGPLHPCLPLPLARAYPVGAFSSLSAGSAFARGRKASGYFFTY